ncbi:MAG: DUF4167 domain-containing protein [Hyphomicrobiaceae bacterium]
MNSNRQGNFGVQRMRPGRDRRNAGAPHNQRQRGPGRNHNGSPGNAQRNYERYMALAREAALSGDTIEMENCYQHAEHYFRMMKERTA